MAFGKVVIVGGTSGLGLALAREFMANGWLVTATGLREETVKNFSAQYPGHRSLRLDVADTAASGKTLIEIISQMGGVDAVVISSGHYDDNPSASWDLDEKAIAVNALGAAAVLNSAFHYFLAKKSGRLVCVTSIGAVRGNAQCPAYNAAKAFLFNYIEGLRQIAALAGSEVSVCNAVPAYVGGKEKSAARAIFRAALKGKRTVYVPAYWRLLAAVYRNVPDGLHEKMFRLSRALLRPFIRAG